MGLHLRVAPCSGRIFLSFSASIMPRKAVATIVPAAAKCMIDERNGSAAIEFATKPRNTTRINKATIDAVGDDRMLQRLPTVTAVTPKRRSLPIALSAEARSVLLLLNFLTAAAVAIRRTTA
jgi:hypothetical protein